MLWYTFFYLASTCFSSFSMASFRFLKSASASASALNSSRAPPTASLARDHSLRPFSALIYLYTIFLLLSADYAVQRRHHSRHYLNLFSLRQARARLLRSESRSYRLCWSQLYSIRLQPASQAPMASAYRFYLMYALPCFLPSSACAATPRIPPCPSCTASNSTLTTCSLLLILLMSLTSLCSPAAMVATVDSRSGSSSRLPRVQVPVRGGVSRAQVRTEQGEGYVWRWCPRPAAAPCSSEQYLLIQIRYITGSYTQSQPGLSQPQPIGDQGIPDAVTAEHEFFNPRPKVDGGQGILNAQVHSHPHLGAEGGHMPQAVECQPVDPTHKHRHAPDQPGVGGLGQVDGLLQDALPEQEQVVKGGHGGQHATGSVPSHHVDLLLRAVNGEGTQEGGPGLGELRQQASVQFLRHLLQTIGHSLYVYVYVSEIMKRSVEIQLFILLMQHLHRRQTDIQYLKTLLAQREIVIQEHQHQVTTLEARLQALTSKLKQTEEQLALDNDRSSKEITNLTMVVKEMQHQSQQLRQEKHQLQFQLNVAKMKGQDQHKEHTKEMQRLKGEYEAQKETLQQKVHKLEQNLATLNSHYHVEEAISEDKVKIIEDANRNLRGFANEKQQRMIIVQNQQLSNEIEYQSRQITSLLEKNERLQDEIKQYRMDLELHRSIEGDLVKRSSLAQNLIKQLNTRVRELEAKTEGKVEGRASMSAQQSRVSQSSSTHVQNNACKEQEQKIAKLKFQIASLKNYTHFLENSQKISNKKYENLGEIMAQYLEVLYIKKKPQDEPIQGSTIVSVDLDQLRGKPIKQWKFQEVEVILDLLLTQIKPYISKSSLTRFPQAKNIQVSFVEQTRKEPVSLPKIIEDYERSQEQAKKGSRFKDIPVDISTKILRSNLREWGTKVAYGSSLPKTRRQASKSIMLEGDRQIL